MDGAQLHDFSSKAPPFGRYRHVGRVRSALVSGDRVQRRETETALRKSLRSDEAASEATVGSGGLRLD
jgi:hypothetical protein